MLAPLNLDDEPVEKSFQRHGQARLEFLNFRANKCVRRNSCKESLSRELVQVFLTMEPACKVLLLWSVDVPPQSRMFAATNFLN